MMVYKHVYKFLYGAKYLRSKRHEYFHLNAMLYHSLEGSHEENLPSKWYEREFPQITKLSHLLKDVDFIDGKLVNINDNSTIIDDNVEQTMLTFKSLARVFIGSPSVQHTIKKNVMASLAGTKCAPFVCFSKRSEREPMIVNKLSKVSNFLNISAQKRKLVRLAICPQVTQHRIWMGALEEMLNELKSDMKLLNCQCPSGGTKMGQQIVSSCLKFLADSAISYDSDSTSWMRLAPAKPVVSPTLLKWEDVLEMFNDLIKCLKFEKGLQFHLTKLEVMKEGLAQIKDVLVDKSIGYKEIRHQESLVQKKLSKTLGHTSQCLFILLLYYLYRHAGHVEVDVCGQIYEIGGGSNFCLCLGKILTSGEEKMVWSGVKQLDRALGVFKFVWEMAEMTEVLELQGHLWCVGAEDRMLKYRGNMFFVHGISL